MTDHSIPDNADLPSNDFDGVPAILSPAQLAQLLDVSVRSLERWRVVGEGPAFQHPKGTRFYRYYLRDVRAWLENK